MTATATPRHLVALGGGGFSMGFAHELDDGLLALTGADHPRVLFVPTASGDAADYIARFYRAFARRAAASHCELFRRDGDLDALCRAQDLIYVGGGNTANMLAVWRIHGMDRALRTAYDAGVVIAGISAGAVCWFEDAVTDSYGLPMRALGTGLGWLPGALVPHYDGEAERRPVTHGLVADRTWPGALAVDDGAAAVFVDERLTEVWSAHPNATAHRIHLAGDQAAEQRLDAITPPKPRPSR